MTELEYTLWELARAIGESPSAQPPVKELLYARSLATGLWRKHYQQTAPHWEPLTDLYGLLSQIDNMLTGWDASPSAQPQLVMCPACFADSSQFASPSAQPSGAPEVLRWIPVTERMPEDGAEVVTLRPREDWMWDDNERYGMDMRDDGVWVAHNNNREHFEAVGGAGAAGPGEICTGPAEVAPYTHWMRILPPPDEPEACATAPTPSGAPADTTEKLCWAVREFVKIQPAWEGSPDCVVRLKVGPQEFTVTPVPMPPDEAAYCAGLFVFALAGAFKKCAAALAEVPAVQDTREAVDAAIRQERRAYFAHNPPNTWLAQTFNNILEANGTFESDAEANRRREESALAVQDATPMKGN